MTPERLARVRALLEGEGMAARVEIAGREGEIAAIRAPTDELGRLRRLAPEIRAMGFRYVALDLGGHAD